tara:strand:+ start:432 stop:1832 length:1401 start_codon:yes stop_codon:yes gene_type:complete
MSLILDTIKSQEIVNHIHTRFEPRYFINKKILERAVLKSQTVMLGDIALLKSGSTPDHSNEINETYKVPFIKSAQIKKNQIDIDNLSFITEEEHQRRNNMHLKEDDILIANTGKFLGSACFITENNLPSTTNQNVARIRLTKDSSDINPYYLVAYLNSRIGQMQINSELTMTNQKYLNMDKLKKFKIPIPEKKELIYITKQTKKYISHDFEARNLLSKAETIFQDNLKVTPYKNSNISWTVNLSTFYDEQIFTPMFTNPDIINTLDSIINKHRSIKLSDIVEISKGNEVEGKDKNELLEKLSSDIPFIRTTDFVNSELDLFPDYYASQDIYDEFEQDTNYGDILFTKDGKIAQVAIVNSSDKMIIASGIARIRMTNTDYCSPEYLFITLKNKYIGQLQALKSTVVGANIPHLKEYRILDFDIPLMDKEIMDQISKLVKDAFKLKDKKNELLENINNCFKTIYKIGY